MTDLADEVRKSLETFDGSCETFIHIMEEWGDTKNANNKYFKVWKVSALYRILGSTQRTDLGSSANNIISKYMDFKLESKKDKRVGEFITLANSISP